MFFKLKIKKTKCITCKIKRVKKEKKTKKKYISFLTMIDPDLRARNCFKCLSNQMKEYSNYFYKSFNAAVLTDLSKLKQNMFLLSQTWKLKYWKTLMLSN